jgi:hypothetical protein
MLRLVHEKHERHEKFYLPRYLVTMQRVRTRKTVHENRENGAHCAPYKITKFFVLFVFFVDKKTN